MKKLANLIKGKYMLTTLILLGAYITFYFIYLAASGTQSFSTWTMFLVNASLVALIVVGLFLKKKEFVLVSFVIFGVTTLYGVITELTGYSSFFNALDGLPGSISHYKDLGNEVKVNVPTILADFLRGSIGLAGLASFILLMLGKVVLKNDKLVKPANIIMSLIPVAFVVYGVLTLISAICSEAWAKPNTVALGGAFGSTYFLYLLSMAFLWTSIACVAYLGLPEKIEPEAEENAPAEETEVEETKTEEPTAEEKNEE